MTTALWMKSSAGAPKSKAARATWTTFSPAACCRASRAGSWKGLPLANLSNRSEWDLTMRESSPMPSTFAQATRPLIIKTALPDSTFVVMSIEAREAISEVYRFEVDLMTENRDSVAFDRLLGQDASVALRRESGSVRHFSGIVCAVRQGENMIVAQDGRPHEYTRFRISIVPKLWLLAQQRRSRIFQHVTVPDILKTVLQETNVEFQLDAAQNTFNERDYCVQYRETDLNFALRLMEEEGIFFFFTHGESGHRMIVANSPMAHPELPGSFRFEPLAAQAGQEDRIWTWQKT